MDAIQALNDAPLKAVFLGHFMLTTWAMLGNWLPSSYLYYNTFLMLTLMWSMHARDSHEPVLLATLINVLSIVMDAISIGVYYDVSHNQAVWFGFSVFMAITNLLLRPITSLVLLRMYNERNGRYSNFGIPGLGGMGTATGATGGFGGAGGSGSAGRGSYENLDRDVPHQSVPSPIRHDLEANNAGSNQSSPYK